MRIVVFDNETERYATDEGVQGWTDYKGMGFSWAEAWDSQTGEFSSYAKADIPALAALLESADLVVGKNILDFDLPHTEAHLGRRLRLKQTWDLQEEVERATGARVKLEEMARATLGEGKIGEGESATVKSLLADKAFARLATYCRRDVRLTRDLAFFVAKYGYLLLPPCERIPLSFPRGVAPFTQDLIPPSRGQVRALRSAQMPVPEAMWKASSLLSRPPSSSFSSARR